MRARNERGEVVWDYGMLHIRHDGRSDAWTLTTFGREPAVVLSRSQTCDLLFRLAESLGVTCIAETT